jgi:hypothetical protein
MTDCWLWCPISHSPASDRDLLQHRCGAGGQGAVELGSSAQPKVPWASRRDRPRGTPAGSTASASASDRTTGLDGHPTGSSSRILKRRPSDVRRKRIGGDCETTDRRPLSNRSLLFRMVVSCGCRSNLRARIACNTSRRSSSFPILSRNRIILKIVPPLPRDLNEEVGTHRS